MIQIWNNKSIFDIYHQERGQKISNKKSLNLRNDIKYLSQDFQLVYEDIPPKYFFSSDQSRVKCRSVVLKLSQIGVMFVDKYGV